MTTVASRSNAQFRDVDYGRKGTVVETADDRSVAVKSRAGSRVYAREDRSGTAVDARRSGARASCGDIRDRAGCYDYRSQPLVIDLASGYGSKWEAIIPRREADGSYVIERDSRGRILDVPGGVEIVPYSRDLMRSRSLRVGGTVVAEKEGTVVSARSRRGSGTIIADDRGTVVKSRAGTIVTEDGATVVKSRAGTVVAAEEGTVVSGRSRRSGTTIIAEKRIEMKKGRDGTIIDEKIRIRARSPGGDTVVAEEERIIGRDRSRDGSAVILGETAHVKGRTPGGSVYSARSGTLAGADRSRAGTEVVAEGTEVSRVRGRRRRSEAVDVATEGGVEVKYNNIPTALRHHHSPESEYRQRSRSASFRRSQVRGHDVSETRHERPGAEAVISGKYLIERPDRTVVEKGTVVAEDKSRRYSTVSGGRVGDASIVSCERVRDAGVTRRGSRRSSRMEALEVDKTSVVSRDSVARSGFDRRAFDTRSGFEVLERRTVVGGR